MYNVRLLRVNLIVKLSLNGRVRKYSDTASIWGRHIWWTADSDPQTKCTVVIASNILEPNTQCLRLTDTAFIVTDLNTAYSQFISKYLLLRIKSQFIHLLLAQTPLEMSKTISLYGFVFMSQLCANRLGIKANILFRRCLKATGNKGIQSIPNSRFMTELHIRITKYHE